MTGNLQIKNGKYYAVLNLKVDGKRKQKWVSTGLSEKCSKKERDKKFREILNRYEANPQLNNSNVLFSDYVITWLKEAKIKVDTVTYQHYENDANNHIIPYFKDLKIKVTDINRQILQGYFNTKFENGRLNGKGGLSAKTLRHHKNIIHQTLELAVINKVISSNPCINITLPKLEKNTYRFFNYEETKQFLNAVKNEPLYPLYLFTVLYGLRRSEVLGIKWDSIDLKAKKLTIQHTRTRCNEIIEKDRTKTKSSLRSFPLSDDIVNLLVKIKLQEKRNKKLFGKEYVSNDYVFKWDNGKPYDPDYITHKFSKTLKKYGLKQISFHGLRHSCGSLLNEQGFTLKDIQEWLGHSDIQTTANIYLHLDTKRKENISKSISSLLI